MSMTSRMVEVFRLQPRYWATCAGIHTHSYVYKYHGSLVFGSHSIDGGKDLGPDRGSECNWVTSLIERFIIVINLLPKTPQRLGGGVYGTWINYYRFE